MSDAVHKTPNQLAGVDVHRHSTTDTAPQTQLHQETQLQDLIRAHQCTIVRHKKGTGLLMCTYVPHYQMPITKCHAHRLVTLYT
jgi:hypothetical protein